MATQDPQNRLDLTIPLGVQGLPIRGTLHQQGRPPRLLFFSPGTLGRTLMNVVSDEADLREWWDLLGAAGVAARRRGEDRDDIVMVSPAQVREIRYNQREVGEERLERTHYKPYKLHTPHLFWILKFQKQALYQAHLYASERLVNSLEEDVRLTAWPFCHGNTGAAGQVCWGGVMINHITPKDPRLAERVFFASGSNHHLFHAPWVGASLGVYLEKHQTVEGLHAPIPIPWGTVTTQTVAQALGDRTRG